MFSFPHQPFLELKISKSIIFIEILFYKKSNRLISMYLMFLSLLWLVYFLHHICFCWQKMFLLFKMIHTNISSNLAKQSLILIVYRFSWIFWVDNCICNNKIKILPRYCQFFYILFYFLFLLLKLIFKSLKTTLRNKSW